jgi:hypothetical protein
MSRSHKKSPIYTEQQHHSIYARYMKNYANRLVRRYRGYIPKGGWWKTRLTGRLAYSICDYTFHYWGADDNDAVWRK